MGQHREVLTPAHHPCILNHLHTALVVATEMPRGHGQRVHPATLGSRYVWKEIGQNGRLAPPRIRRFCRVRRVGPHTIRQVVIKGRKKTVTLASLLHLVQFSCHDAANKTSVYRQQNFVGGEKQRRRL